MATVAEIEQMFDRKITAMKKEIVAELKTEVKSQQMLKS
jgi:hypothetical protein